MSGVSMFPSRICWGPHGGLAAFNGFRFDLRCFPAIVGLENVTELDFVPGHVAYVRIGSNARRDLEAPERAAITSWLEGVTAAMRDIVERTTAAVQR